MDKGVVAKILFKVLTIIFAAILMLSVVKICFGGNTVSFASFLEYVSHTPQIDVTYQQYAIVLGDWGAFNFLRYFFEALSTIINVAIWICRNVANLLLVLSYFVSFLFVV